MFPFSLRRLLHLAAYLLAVFLVLAIFFVVLVLAESTFYALTGKSVSTWALIVSALVATLLFLPVVHALQRVADRVLFRRHLDLLAAIRHLGVRDLASLPDEDVERALLSRICEVSHRKLAALDERQRGGNVYLYPENSCAPPPACTSTPMLRPEAGVFELCMELPGTHSHALLYLGAHEDGVPSDDEEVQTLQGLAQFAAMSLEHARLSHQQAKHARLDSLTRVSSQLHSHDLKNRLNDLSFLAHNLMTARLETDDVGRLVNAISKVVDRMQTLMQRMSDPEAPLHPKLMPLDLTQLLQESIESRLWPENIHIEADLPSLPLIHGDAAMLRGVFETLFDNAVQATQHQGIIKVRAAMHETNVEVCVQDDGCGMSALFMRERLFRLFSSNKESGLGIGLYLSRRIIEAHHGNIRADSAGEGQGSVFCVSIPTWDDTGG